MLVWGGLVKFTKPALTLEQQVEQLLSRGMKGDPAQMGRRLASVNYYRLSGYWYTYRNVDGSRFIPGTDFEVVWGRYVFDRELRLLAMDALERFEVAVRARLAYEHAQAGGPFGYDTDPAAIFEGRADERAQFFKQLDDAVERNGHEAFIKHFRGKYQEDHARPPVWVAVEVLMFGDVVRLFRGSSHALQRRVADAFGVAAKVMESWLKTLNVIRNICAHHGRLWNRELGVKPKIPRDEAWRTPVVVQPDRVFSVLTILAHLLWKIAPGSTWSLRVRDLVDGSPVAELGQMGFPADWHRCEVWRRAWEAGEG